MKPVQSIALTLLVLGLVTSSTANTQAQPSKRPDALTDRGPLEKKVFIHHRKDINNQKPPWAGGGNGNGGSDKDSGPTCYDDLAKGVVWKNTPQDIYVQKDSNVLDNNVFLGLSATAAGLWDHETSTSLFDEAFLVEDADWDDEATDGRNEISFGNYPDSSAIAVTVTWGYFSGPPQTREIIEFDILFNTQYSWNTDGNQDDMDYLNIAVHELGHGWGLADIYDTGCSEVTMYGYSTEGETSKTTLEPADIEGIQSLYN